MHLVPCMGPSKTNPWACRGPALGGKGVFGLGDGSNCCRAPLQSRAQEALQFVAGLKHMVWSVCASPQTHLLSLLLTAEHTLAVQLEALCAVVHALEDGGRGLADHGHAVPLFPLPTLQALHLQELPGETQTPGWPEEPQTLHLGCTRHPTDVRGRSKTSPPEQSQQHTLCRTFPYYTIPHHRHIFQRDTPCLTFSSHLCGDCTDLGALAAFPLHSPPHCSPPLVVPLNPSSHSPCRSCSALSLSQ